VSKTLRTTPAESRAAVLRLLMWRGRQAAACRTPLACSASDALSALISVRRRPAGRLTQFRQHVQKRPNKAQRKHAVTDCRCRDRFKGDCTRCIASSVCTYFAEVGGKRLHFVPCVEVEVGQPRDAELLAEVHHLLRVSVHL
jgi:hypothetical protein